MKKTLMSLAIMLAILVSPGISEAKIVEWPTGNGYIGLLDDKELVNYLFNSPNMFDNKPGTFGTFNNLSGTLVTFNYPVHIKSAKADYQTPYSKIRFTLVGGTSQSFNLPTVSGVGGGAFNVDLKNVTSIYYEVDVLKDNKLYEIEFYGTYDTEPKTYDKPHTLTATSTANSIDLNWINPNLIGFQNVLLYVNGQLKATLGADTTKYQLNKLDPETSYQIELVAKYDDDGLSEKEILTINTKKVEPEEKEIQSLTAKATHERVDLSWQLPIYQDTFKYVNIYRGLADEDFDRFTLNTVKPSSKTIKKIFETNGTYFNDLTVEPSTTYDYKLSVAETNNTETEGILTRVTTAPKPEPSIEDLIIKKEGDDYVVTWTNDEGKVKIDLDGNLYKELDANIKQVVIPAKDMKYDVFGKPLITVTYIDKDGTSSKPSKPSQSGPGFEDKELKLPFTIGTFLTVLMDLIKIVGPFILLSLAIAFAPRIIDLIKKASNRKGNK